MHPEHLQRFDWISCTGVKHPSNETVFGGRTKMVQYLSTTKKQPKVTGDDNGDHYMSGTERAGMYITFVFAQC